MLRFVGNRGQKNSPKISAIFQCKIPRQIQRKMHKCFRESRQSNDWVVQPLCAQSLHHPQHYASSFWRVVRRGGRSCNRLAGCTQHKGGGQALWKAVTVDKRRLMIVASAWGEIMPYDKGKATSMSDFASIQQLPLAVPPQTKNVMHFSFGCLSQGHCRLSSGS